MSILSRQNLLAGSSAPDQSGSVAEQSPFAAYSFAPPMSKRASAGSDEAGKFLYNSPTKSYAPSADMQVALGQGNFGEGIGVDGTPIHKDTGTFTDTKYGPGDGTEGVAPRMTSSDSSLLTGIAKVIGDSETPLSETYTAKDYFLDRTPRATRSFRTTTDEGKNGNGSGADRAYYTSASRYPAEILTNGAGSEFVPVTPSRSESVNGTGIFNLIPKTPAAANTTVVLEDVDVPDDSGNSENDAVVDAGDDSVAEVSLTMADQLAAAGVDKVNLATSEGGDATAAGSMADEYEKRGFGTSSVGAGGMGSSWY